MDQVKANQRSIQAKCLKTPRSTESSALHEVISGKVFRQECYLLQIPILESTLLHRCPQVKKTGTTALNDKCSEKCLEQKQTQIQSTEHQMGAKKGQILIPSRKL